MDHIGNDKKVAILKTKKFVDFVGRDGDCAAFIFFCTFAYKLL